MKPLTGNDPADSTPLYQWSQSLHLEQAGMACKYILYIVCSLQDSGTSALNSRTAAYRDRACEQLCDTFVPVHRGEMEVMTLAEH